MILTENSIDKDLLSILEKITKLYTTKDIELVIADSREIKKLNKEFRGKNRPTDVLSFPLIDTPFAPLGSIVICKDFVTLRSQNFKHSKEDEFTLLFIHGLLHLIGYDHEVNKKMRKEEERIIKKFNLPKSLIIRSESC